MSKAIKNQREILEKLGIEQLNPMQRDAHAAIHSNANVLLLSATGTGKTLAFLLPMIAELDPSNPHVQALILTPTRELAIQIETVIREIGSGFKCNAVYGGRSVSKDKIELSHTPAILVGTPGRVADHIRRETFTTEDIKTLVLDEFDKSLEIGFAEDMSEILFALPNVKKKILTSATQKSSIPGFVEFQEHKVVDYSDEGVPNLEVKLISSPEKDKLNTLLKVMEHLGNQAGIIFCNFKESIARTSEFLDENNIPHGCFHGDMEQKDRERSLIKFRNGTYKTLLATDLAARGIDVPEIAYILHYQLPSRLHEFTHRNGRTARMNADGVAYVLKWKQELLPEFIPKLEEAKWPESSTAVRENWETFFVSGGRKDKISKGDLAGLFFKQGKLDKDALGLIELKQDCAFVGVKTEDPDQLIALLDNGRIKGRKLRVNVI
jgi:superfamily II DNA/RNA helicase